MNSNWENDPRIANMNQEKISFLKKYAKLLSHTQKSDLISLLLTMNKEAAGKNLHFSNDESELILAVITSNLTPAEKEKLNALKAFTQKKRNSKN